MLPQLKRLNPLPIKPDESCKLPHAIVGKPGLYYNRISKECWCEFADGDAYKVAAAIFFDDFWKSDFRRMTNDEFDAAVRLLKTRMYDDVRDDVVKECYLRLERKIILGCKKTKRRIL